MLSLGGPSVDRVDAEAILATVRESVATAVAIQMQQHAKEIEVKLNETIYEVKQLSCRVKAGVCSGSFRSTVRSDPGRARLAKSPFSPSIEAKRSANKHKNRRDERNKTLYQLNELLFDEILKSKQLDQRHPEDGQNYGAAPQSNPAQSSTGPTGVPMQTSAKDQAHEVPGTAESPAAPVSTLAEQKPGVAQDNCASVPERSVCLPITLGEEKEVAVDLPISLQEEKELAVDLPGAPDPPPPLMPVVPDEPKLDVAELEACMGNGTTGMDSINGSKKSKPTGRVRMEGAEAIVQKAANSCESDIIEEEPTSLVPFANFYFGKKRLLCATLLFSYFAGLCVSLPIKVATWPHVHFLRDCSLALYAAAAVVGSYMMNDASAVAHKMMLWASAHRISDTWLEAARVCLRRSCLCWLLMLACALLTEVLIVHPEGMKSIQLQTQEIMTLFVVSEVLSLFVFVVASYLLVCTAYFQAHLLIGLDLFIDKWCCDILDDADFELGVSSWNIVQAFIRRVGNAIDNSLSALLMSAFLGCGTVAVRAIAFGMQPNLHWGIAIEACSSLPLLLLVILAGTVFVQCSGISEKCAILPSLINQINPSDDFFIMDQERHYLVDYLTNSAAGIYVKGVKLTMTTVVKTAHTFGVALFAVLGLAVRMSH